MSKSASYWIDKLQLVKHAEGGYYRETYRSSITVDDNHLPHGFQGKRNVCTAIYFLLKGNEFSAFHRIASDEIWHFYDGDALSIYEIETDGRMVEHSLGSDAEAGQVFQQVIKAGNWFASRGSNGEGYTLVGCTVSPGFDFEDFEMAKPLLLIEQFPQHKLFIAQLTR